MKKIYIYYFAFPLLLWLNGCSTVEETISKGDNAYLTAISYQVDAKEYSKIGSDVDKRFSTVFYQRNLENAGEKYASALDMINSSSNNDSLYKILYSSYYCYYCRKMAEGTLRNEDIFKAVDCFIKMSNYFPANLYSYDNLIYFLCLSKRWKEAAEYATIMLDKISSQNQELGSPFTKNTTYDSTYVKDYIDLIKKAQSNVK